MISLEKKETRMAYRQLTRAKFIQVIIITSGNQFLVERQQMVF